MSFMDWILGPPNIEKLEARGNVKGLIKALHYGKDSHVRSDAAKALGELGDVRAVEPLVAALKDGSMYVRRAAAEALVAIYRMETLDDAQKHLILTQKDVITREHYDSSSSSDCNDYHDDRGIGMGFDFPGIEQ